MFTLICARINGWVNNREAGDLTRYRAHYDVIVMILVPVAHLNNGILPAIQIRWKIRLAVIPLLVIKWQQIFAHATTSERSCHGENFTAIHDDVIKWKYFPRYWPFVRGIHRSPVNYPHKGQWRGALMFTLICAWRNGWVYNRGAGDLRRYRLHYDVIVMHFDRIEVRVKWYIHWIWMAMEKPLVKRGPALHTCKLPSVKNVWIEMNFECVVIEEINIVDYLLNAWAHFLWWYLPIYMS